MITDAKKGPPKIDSEKWEPVFGSPLPKEFRVDAVRHAVKDLFKKQREAADSVDKGETRRRLDEAGLPDGFHKVEKPFWIIARLESFRKVDRYGRSIPSIRNLDGPDGDKVLRNVRTSLHRGIMDAINAGKLGMGGQFAYRYKGCYISREEVMLAHKYETKPKSDWGKSLHAQAKKIKTRRCRWCGTPLPERAKANRKFCKRECKEAAKQSRIRKR